MPRSSLPLALVAAVFAIAHPLAAAEEVRTLITRSIAYHEITDLATSVEDHNWRWPVLAGNGSRAVFSLSLAPLEVWVVDRDGSDLTLVDTFTAACFCTAAVDISADGAKVLASEGVQLRMANASGGGWPLVTLAGNEIDAVDLPGSGGQAFFQVRRDTTLAANGNPVERGIWAVNANGTGLHQITGPGAVASLLGVAAGDVFPFDGNGWSLGVSADGGEIVFAAWVSGLGNLIFAVNGDGSNLHRLLPEAAIGYVNQVAISADGGTVGYNITYLPCCSSPSEIGVVDFAGSGRLALWENATFGHQYPGSDDPLVLSDDGSKLLLGSTGLLVATDGSGLFQVGVRCGYWSGDQTPLVFDGLFRATMDGSASTILYAVGDDAGIHQLAVAEIAPASFGDAPTVSDPSFTPPWVYKASSWSVVTAQVATPHTVTRVSNAGLRNGRTTSTVWRNVMLDDGSLGDPVPGDGQFTESAATTNNDAVVGSYLARVKAEVRTASGRRHATAVDFGPVDVLAPGDPIPLLFSDGFETGGSTLWSVTVP